MSTTIHDSPTAVRDQLFELVGPHEGKTMNVNGHMFEDGEFTYRGTARQIEGLARVLAFYGAFPAEQADAMRSGKEQAPRDSAVVTREQLDEALSKLPGDQDDQDYVVTAMRSHFGDLFTQGDEDMVRSLVPVKDKDDGAGSQTANDRTDAGNNGTGEGRTLGEAIGLLDPENAAHWTSNNLPALDVLSAQVGRQVARAEVEELAPGYTRAAARKAKQ